MAGPQLGVLEPPAGVQNSVLLIVEANSSLLGGLGLPCALSDIHLAASLASTH